MHEAGAAMAFGEEREPAYRLDRLTSDRPQRERPAVAAAAVGLLAVGVIVLLHAGAYPTAHACGSSRKGSRPVGWKGYLSRVGPR
jgi:hypothetical protein